VKDKSPEEQLDWFMSKYTPEIQILAPAPFLPLSIEASPCRARNKEKT
jgi:hypothetical protein